MPQIGFHFSVIPSEVELANRLLGQIQTYHPDAPVAIVGDGEFDPKGLQLSQNCRFFAGEHLKRVGCVGKFSHRNFSAALEHCQSDWIVKLDPDSYLVRPIQHFPAGICWAGVIREKTLEWGRTRWARGGGLIIARAAAQQIVASNLLLHPRYYFVHSFERQRDRVYANCRLGHVADLLNLKLSKWREAYMLDASIMSATVPHLGVDAAIVHPVKKL